MKRCIATVSLSGTLEDKLRAIAAAGFDGVEVFENDLVNSGASPREISELAESLGLTIDLFQPFRDLEGVPDEVFRKNLERIERKFDVMGELGAPMLLVCSNVGSQALADPQRSAAQLYAAAERAAQHGIRIAYEALAWGRHVRTYAQAWDLVRRADHASLGVCVDSFHTLALGDDPRGIASIPGDKIFFLQLADAPKLQMDPLSWSRHFRCFPGQGELDVTALVEQVLCSGYRGPLSLEIFNDVFRSSDTRQTAVDAMRSLLYLEESIGAHDSAPQIAGLDRVQPPPPQRLNGVGFLEFAVDADTGRELAAWLTRLGFAQVGTHRSKAVTLFRQGRINLILNAEPDSFAQGYFQMHGPALCAIALRTSDEFQALERGRAMLGIQIEGRNGPNERNIPALRSIDGSLLYLLGGDEDSAEPFATDFLGGDVPTEGVGLRRVDHIAMALPPESMNAWILFYRSILGLEPQPVVEQAELYGLMRSRAMVAPSGRVRMTLNASEGRNSMMARSLSAFSGSGVHHIALECDDIFASIEGLQANGIEFLMTPANYYDDLAARLDLPEELVDRLRTYGILYDRSTGGEFFHIPTETFKGRFSFEIVQRAGDYAGHGEPNAPAFLAAQARSLLEPIAR
ncbi:MAG: sugar phosphate isomerase/epimerase and 4-hydroxyphenylpyruvate domain-containing protein [Chloroflexi bacterium]|nr:sugar phosphate isomerase/epimerase and 4-hydroxyphenylpyruvate domain-containing protein [Chloroflexota bacterium]